MHSVNRGVATGGVRGAIPPPLLPLPILISEPNKVQQFQFQTQGILLILTTNLAIFTVYAKIFELNNSFFLTT